MVNKYHQKNKEKFGIEALERYQNLSKEEKEKGASIIMLEIRIFLKRKRKNLSI